MTRSKFPGLVLTALAVVLTSSCARSSLFGSAVADEDVSVQTGGSETGGFAQTGGSTQVGGSAEPGGGGDPGSGGHTSSGGATAGGSDAGGSAAGGSGTGGQGDAPQPVDPCDPEPCLNGGVCMEESSGFFCECPADFVGALCDSLVFEAVSDLEPCDHQEPIANDLSADGNVVVGACAGRAMRWTSAEGVTVLDFGQAGAVDVASAVSANGDTIVGIFVDADQAPYAGAIEWRSGAPVETFLPQAEGDSIWITDANDDLSVLVGDISLAEDDPLGFYWDEVTGLQILPDQMESTNALVAATNQDGSLLAGAWRDPSGQAAVWQIESTDVERRLLEDEAFNSSRVTAVSDLGDVLAGYRVNATNRNPEAVIWTRVDDDWVIQSVAFEGWGSEALGLSRDGSTVLGTTVVDQFVDDRYAWIWSSEKQLRRVDVYLDELGVDIQGWKLLSATHISADHKVILGTGRDANGEGGFWIVRMP